MRGSGYRCGIKSKRLWLKTLQPNHEVAALGVQQGDLRPQNVLWNNELNCAIVIDFEYAHVEEAKDKIRSAIAGKAKAKKKIKILGQTSGNWVLIKLKSKITSLSAGKCVMTGIWFKHFEIPILVKAICLDWRHVCGGSSSNM